MTDYVCFFLVCACAYIDNGIKENCIWYSPDNTFMEVEVILDL